MQPSIIETNDKWVCQVIEVRDDGVLVDFSFVNDGETRFVPNGEYKVIHYESTNHSSN